MKSLFLPLFTCLLFSTLFSVLKTSNIDVDEPFRMRKVNLVWQKAKRLRFGQDTLNELYVELERQDRDEKKWKHQKNEGKDKLGEMEAIIRRNMLNIMDKYGLLGGDSSDAPRETGDHIETNRVTRGGFVKDERLEKLWEHAVSEDNFNKEELEDLRQELTHHHEKWKQYRDLVGLLSEQEDRQTNIVGNKVPQHVNETVSKLRDEMNMRYQEVNSNYRRLKVKVLQGTSEEEFKDYRVQDLWKRAKAQGLSPEELEVMKEELRHFENKIAKHDDIQEQLNHAEDLISQGYDHIKHKHEKLSVKVKEHKRYIKKLHTTLDKKIGSHNEL